MPDDRPRTIGRRALMAPLVAIAWLPLAAVSAAEDNPQPGLWKFTTKSLAGNDPAREHSETQCLKSDMASALQTGFGPRGCPYSTGWNGNTLNSRTECRDASGQKSVSMIVHITFDAPWHFAGVVKSTGSIAGRPVNAEIGIEGQRIDECDK